MIPTASQGKVSAGFSARLARMSPSQKVRAVVVLGGAGHATSAGRPGRAERQAIASSIKRTGAGAIKDLHAILKPFGGRILSDQPTALGTITIESTPAGIAALSKSDAVRVILEDQPVSRSL